MVVFHNHHLTTAMQGTPAEIEAEFDIVVNDAWSAATVMDVACEQWINVPGGRRKTHQPMAQLVCGKISVLSPVEVRMQKASDAKNFVPDLKLKQLGLWHTGEMIGQPDADDLNSAMRHALLLMGRRHATVYKTLLDARSDAGVR